MSVFIVAEVQVFDPSITTDYSRLAGESIADFEGRILVRSSVAERVEGDWAPGTRFVIVEFRDAETARAWYESDTYRKARELAKRGMNRRIAVVESEPVAQQQSRDNTPR